MAALCGFNLLFPVFTPGNITGMFANQIMD